MKHDEKDLLASSTTWGVIVAVVVAPLLRQFGIEIGDQTVAADVLAQIAGGALALFGNFKRSQRIGSVAGIRLKRADR